LAPERRVAGQTSRQQRANPATIHQLATCAWVREGHPLLCWSGTPTPASPTCSSALGPVGAETGYRVRYIVASKLLNELVASRSHCRLRA